PPVPEHPTVAVPGPSTVTGPATSAVHLPAGSLRMTAVTGSREVGSDPAIDVANPSSRPIAIAHSRLSRVQRSASKDSPQSSSSTSRNVSTASHTAPPTGADASVPLWRSNTSTSVATSQPQHIARDVGPYPAPRTTTPLETQPAAVVPRIPEASSSQEPQPHRQSHAESALCFSPGRMRDHNRNPRQSEINQRKPLVNAPKVSRSQEKNILLTRLRVLEGMIQRTAIEESRLQPPEVLRRQRLVEDMESMASIYSSSMELDYDRIHRELSNGTAQDKPEQRRYPKDHSPPRRASSNRADVLGRLKSGSQARAVSPLRASIYDRQFAANSSSADKSSTGLSERHHRSTAAQAGSAPMGLPSAGAPDMSLVS
ncbi:hypothetical protein IW150_007422, partial [Coemansia sp. RSA 2607]